MRILIFITSIIFLSSCKNEILDECPGTYIISNESDSTLKDDCIKLIILENNSFVLINNCKVISGTWDMTFNELIPMTFYDTKTKYTHYANYGKKSIKFHNPQLLLGKRNINNLVLRKE